MAISAAQVRELRDLTGAGMMDCKQALEEADGDIESAIRILREKGLAGLKRKAAREAREGIVESYVHAGAKIGVLVEVNCETDFVARNEEFKSFAHDLAMQIAATNPRFVSRDVVPVEVIEREKEILRAQAMAEGKPGTIVDQIVEGRLEKFFSEVCLLEQPFIRDGDVLIRDLLGSYASKLGENIVIRRFERFQVGELE